MKWSLWVAALLVLAGCADAPDEARDDHDHDHDDHNDHDDDGHDHTQPGHENHTQAPSFAADVLNGTAPLTVNFTWQANTWSLDLEGDGEADHAGMGAGNLSHVYDAGTWNATLTSGNETFVIVITAHEPVVQEPEVLHHSEGTADFVLGISSGDPEYALQCPGFIAAEQGQGCVFFDFADLDGLPYAMESSGPALRFAFWSACDPTSSGLTGGSNAGRTHSGTIPAGAGCVVIWSPATDTAGGAIDYTFTVTSF